MAVEIKKLENSSVEFIVTLEGQEIKPLRTKVLQSIAREVELPGFRKGKAPLATVEGKFAGTLKEEVAEAILKQNFETIVKENNLRPVDYVRTIAVELTEDKFVGTFQVDVYPEVTLGEYKGLEVTKEEVNFSEEAVNTEIENLLDTAAKLVEAEEGYRAQLEDTITLDFEGFIDGVAFEGGKAEAYALQLGSKSFIDTFEDQLVGYAVGQEGDITVSFPAEYFKEDLAGKPATFKVKVTSIKKLEKPALDDEFSKDNGFDDLADLKAKKSAELKEKEEKRVESAYRNVILSKVIENASLIVPVSMINREVQNRLAEFENSLKQQGANLEMYLQMSGLTMDGVADQVRPMAEGRVRRDIVLGAIAEAEGLSVEDAEVETKMAEISKLYNMDADTLKAELIKAKNFENFVENLKVDIEIQKTIEFLVANVK